MKMTTEEAFIKVLQRHGIEHAFGIIGSAMMPVSDLFPAAGIKFWDCAHEGNAGMCADGYTRATGMMSMAIAQNGPGITNMVTPIMTAYWNHTPLLLVTPQAANRTIGQGGFQEMKQMALFQDCVCYQEEVRDPSRIAEVLNRVRAPFNVNIAAQRAAVAALADQAHVEHALQHNAKWRALITAEIRKLGNRGIRVDDSAGNFLLVHFADARRAQEADRFLMSRGVILRGCASYGLPQCLRLTIGSEEANRVALAALKDFAAS